MWANPIQGTYTSVSLQKKKIRQSYRVGTTGMDPGGYHNPLTDSENLKET
jgi:hypothetical protein